MLYWRRKRSAAEVRTLTDQKAIIAFVFPLPEKDDALGLQRIIGPARTLFVDIEDLKVYAAIRDKATEIIDILAGKKREVTSSSTTFSDAENKTELLFQLAGAASTCWEHLNRAGIFDSEQAKKFCEDALLRLDELNRPTDLKGDLVDIGPECFTNGEVISYKGQNYFLSCAEYVSDLDDGGQSFCVKRINHPGHIHEDYAGTTREDDGD